MKADFMSKVFANLIFQSFLAYSTARMVIDNKEISRKVMENYILLFLTYIGLILLYAFRRFQTSTKFIIFSILSVLTGALMSSLRTFDDEALKEALAATVGIFVVMFIAGVISTQFNIDMIPVALGLFALYLITLVVSVFKKGSSKVFVPIFALFILVETNLMLRKNYNGDFVNGSLSYFTDIVNLFSQLLRMNED
jgi:FtsH-binding integral membrane protein